MFRLHFVMVLGLVGAIGWMLYAVFFWGNYAWLLVLPFLILFLPVMMAITSESWRDRSQRQLDARYCLKCGYDLTGNVSQQCPECGSKVLR